MAAPSGIVWGSIVNSKGRIGIYTSTSSTNTQTTVSIQVWFWSKWSVTDKLNDYYFNNNASSATTRIGDVTIRHTVATGDGWSTSNQTMLGSYSYTYNRDTSAKTIYCAAKLATIEAVDGTMTAVTKYTIPALNSYTVSYVANGGSGAPTKQVKWYGIALTLSTTKPTHTGYSFLGWATSSTATSADYAAGASYTANASVNLYAVWKANTYTISYNANGGSGAPSSQTKTYGVALTLSSTKPTRTNYNFLGWGLSASSTTVSYASGASYTGNAALTLYAVWELAYTKPRITGLTVVRCDSSGTTSDTGTYFKTSFSWATDKTVSSIKMEWKTASATTWTSSTVSASGTSGTVSKILGAGEVSVDSTYDIRVTVSDSVGSTAVTRSLAGAAYPIDFLAGGNGVAIGKPAETAGLFDVVLDTNIDGDLDVTGAISTTGALSAASGKFTGALTASSATVDGIPVTGNSVRLYSNNKTTSVDDDITSAWNDPNGLTLHYYNASGALTDKPSDYGLILNANNGVNIHQLWFTQPSGVMAHRGGNASGWSGTWRTIFDDANYTDYCVPKTGGTFSGYTILNNAVNCVGYFRMHNDYIGFFGSSANAQNNTSRKGWIGYDGSTNFCVVVNGSGGSIIMSNGGGSNTVNKAWTVSSDQRFKDDINNIPAELIEVWKELLPKTFKWNELNHGGETVHFGLIAQDVISAFEKHGLDYRDYGFVVPYKNRDDDTEYYSITYDSYHMLTAAVLRETNAKLENQQQQIDILRQQINELKELISKEE